MALETQSLSILHEALECLDEGFENLPDHDIDLDIAGLQTVMLKVAEKMRDNYPYHHRILLRVWLICCPCGLIRTTMPLMADAPVQPWKKKLLPALQSCSGGRHI